MGMREHDYNNVLTSAKVFKDIYEDLDDEDIVNELENDKVYPHIIQIILAMRNNEPYDHIIYSYIDNKV